MELVQQPEVQDIYGHHTVFIGLYTGDCGHAGEELYPAGGKHDSALNTTAGKPCCFQMHSKFHAAIVPRWQQDIYGHHTVFIGLYTGDKPSRFLHENTWKIQTGQLS